VSLARRGAAWALTLAGVAGLGLLLLLAPPIRDYEEFLLHGPNAAAPYFAEHPAGWMAVRAPQMYARSSPTTPPTGRPS